MVHDADDFLANDDSSDPPQAPAPAGRRWLGIMFECCGVYSRIYRDASGSAYAGRCPRCYRQLRVPIGPGGTSGRFFRAE